jgi:hypothetical protein
VTGTIRTFAAIAMLALFASGPLQGPGAAMADPAAGDDAAWREIQLRRRAIESLRKAAADAEEKAVTKLAKELKRKKIAPSQEGELQTLLKGLLTPEQLALLKVEAGAAGCEDLESVVAKWRVATAKALFAVSKKASKAGFDGSAYRYAERAVAFDPEQKQARAALGLVKAERGWLAGWRAKREASGQVFDERVGWLPSRDLPKVGKGLLPLEGRWLPTAEVEDARRKWSSRWVLSWGRWRIETDVSREVMIEAAKLLSELDRAVSVALGDRFVTRSKGSLSVLIFSKRVDYEAEIDRNHSDDLSFKSQPGFFCDKDEAVHVLWTEGIPMANRRLVLHEATHALVSSLTAVSNGKLREGEGSVFEETLALCSESLASPGASLTSDREPGIVPELQGVLVGGRRRSLREVSADAATGGTSKTVEEFYQFALALGLFCGGTPGDNPVPWQIQEYLYYLRHHGPNPGLFAKMMGKSWPELEKDWSAFLDKLAAEGAQKQKK